MTTTFSDLRTRKLTRLFHVYDENHDGVLEQRDYTALSSRLAALKGAAAGTPAHEGIKTAYGAIWDQLVSSDVAKDGKVSVDGWLKFCAGLLSSTERYDRMVNRVATNVIELVDDDGDGVLTDANWKRFFEGYGINDTPSGQVFTSLDLNKDGKLTKDEVLAALKDFFYSEDAKAPGNLFFGKF